MDKELRDKALDILENPANSKLVTHLNACVHCGLCGTSCLFFRTYNEPKYIPGKKVDLVALNTLVFSFLFRTKLKK